MNTENAVLALDATKRGTRMTEEQAEAILKAEGFHLAHSSVTYHAARHAETVTTLWDSADYSRRARLRVAYSV